VIDSYGKSGFCESNTAAQTRAIISTKDVAIYHHAKRKNGEEPQTPGVANKPTKALGTAYVYYPDLLSVADVKYGGKYIDVNNATNAILDAARKLVNLPELEFGNGIYKLKSNYAQIASYMTHMVLMMMTTLSFRLLANILYLVKRM